MKKVFLSLLFISTFLVSCDENSTADVSRVTNYPEFTLLGDEIVYVQKGSAYTDAGVEVEQLLIQTLLTSIVLFIQLKIRTDFPDLLQEQ